MPKSCPPVTLNIDAVVDAVKEKIMKDNPQLSPGPAVNSVGVKGLGRIGLVEPEVKADQFILGFVTLPSVVNFATKLMQVGVLLPQADLALTRGGAALATLVATFLTGGKSFLLGAFLGQFPSTLDAIADFGVAALAKNRGVAVNPNVDLHGIGASPDEELKKLRQDLQKLQGSDEMSGSEQRRSVVFSY